MICETCGEQGLVEATETYHYIECGLPNIHLEGITLRKCPACGSVMPLIPAMSRLHLAITRDLIKKPGPLTPAEIVFLRKYLGWSGVDFARNLHSSSSQVSKWESGKVAMSTQAELLLREIVARGKKIEDYHSYEIARKKQFKALPHFFQLVNDEWQSAA